MGNLPLGGDIVDQNAVSGSFTDKIAPTESVAIVNPQTTTSQNTTCIDLLNSYDQSQEFSAENEPEYMTGSTGVQNNPAAPPKEKEMHTIEPPKVSTQHF
jgi:hypothetical protein